MIFSTFLSINNNNILHTQVVVVGPSRTLVVSNRTDNNDESNTRRANIETYRYLICIVTINY